MAEYIIQKETLVNIANAIREVLSTDNLYTPEEMAIAIKDNVVNSSSLINYNITFSSSSSETTIVVIYSQWTNEGIKIITQDISSTTTVQILQNSSFTIMGVDGTYPLSSVQVSDNIFDIRSIQSTVYYSYCFSCNGDGTIHFAY